MCRAMAETFAKASTHDDMGREMVFLDVGSNIGFHSLCVGAGSIRTISVEANTQNYGALWTSIHKNKWQQKMTAFNVAVSDGTATEPLCFRVFPGNMGGNSAISPEDHQSKDWHTDIPCDYVNVTTVDTLLSSTVELLQQERALCPLVMKMDVEGFEHRALTGSKALLELYSPCMIYMELHVPLLLAAKAAPPIETMRLLQSRGYKPKSHTVTAIKDVIKKKGVVNLVWVHKTIDAAGSGDSCWERCLPSTVSTYIG